MKESLNELALFAGAGGGLLGSRLLGWRTKCAVEIDSYARKVLLARQRDGMLERFPIWDDIKTFEGKRWRGSIDVVSGGFPCQDISAAGKGKGIGGKRSGLWKHMARVVGEVQPSYVLVENSPMLISRGLDVVLADLAAMGFNAEWGVISAENAGALHKRERLWILAYSNMLGFERDKNKVQRIFGHEILVAEKCKRICESNVYRKSYVMADRLDRIRCIGNGQVPSVVRLAWLVLSENAKERQNENSSCL